MSFSIRASQGVLAGVSGPGWPGGLGGWPQVSRSELLQEGLQGCFAARLQCPCPGVHIQVALPWGCSWSGRVLLYGGFPHQTAFGCRRDFPQLLGGPCLPVLFPSFLPLAGVRPAPPSESSPCLLLLPHFCPSQAGAPPGRVLHVQSCLRGLDWTQSSSKSREEGQPGWQ